MEITETKERISRLTNGIVSASATFIVIIALATAVYQAKVTHDQARSSIWPYLLQGNSSNDGYSRIVQNVGLGPAIIRSFEVTVDNHVVRSWKEAAESLHAPLRFQSAKSTIFRAGIVLPTNTLTELLQISDTVGLAVFRSQLKRLDTHVCYCSLYGDCWSERASEIEPKPVKACQDEPSRRFLE